jgi:antitoxin VapB
MITATVFENNNTQAVRLPLAVRYPSSVKKVMVRSMGHERVLVPVEHTWDSFFLSPEQSISDDFMNERPEQRVSERASFDD